LAETAQWRRRIVALTAAVLAAAPAAQAATVFTIAGSQSSGAAIPLLCGGIRYCGDVRPWPSVWAATALRFDGSCLDHYPDGSILLCSDGRPIRMTPDGRARALPVHGIALGLSADGGVGLFVSSVDVGPDGSVVVGGMDGAATVAPDGAARWLVVRDRDEEVGGADVLADGSALLAEPLRERVERVWPDGRRQVVAGAGHRATGDCARAQADIGWPVDVSAFPDGSFVIADGCPRGRVLRVDAAGVVHPLAGEGRGWHEGAPATAVSIGRVSVVRALGDGRVLVAADRGVLQIGLDGRIRTLVRGVAYGWEAGYRDPRSVDTDGRAASDVALSGITDVDVLPDGRLAVLTHVPEGGSRLALIGEPDGLERLAIALPGEDRQLVRAGRLDVITTRSATVRVTSRDARHGSLTTDLVATVPAGRSAIAIPPARGPRVNEFRVEATSADGRVAGATITAIPEPRLTKRAVDALTWAVDFSYIGSFSDQETRLCRRASQVAFACHWVFEEEGERSVFGRSCYMLRPDGLVDYAWHRTHRRSRHLILEPTW
jgi:hypothetical protein